ncbi:MAG: hypothetical protein AB7I44_12045 [Hyphomicrobiaceae bacterium]
MAGQACAQEQPTAPQLPPDDKAASDAAASAMSANADWPCVQHKLQVLTAVQMWDGPAIASEGKSSDDETIRKLVPIIASRRIPMDEVEKDITAFADALPAEQRDKKLAELFSATLAEINETRSSVVDGIEKFQRRQILRSKKLEADGAKLAELLKASDANPKDQEAARLAQEAQSRYDWDARVFQERQQNIPIACEIPVLIEQRAFAIGQAIRNLMEK